MRRWILTIALVGLLSSCSSAPPKTATTIAVPELDPVSGETLRSAAKLLPERQEFAEVIRLGQTITWADLYDWPWVWLPDTLCMTADVGAVIYVDRNGERSAWAYASRFSHIVPVEIPEDSGAWYVTTARFCVCRDEDGNGIEWLFPREYVRAWATTGPIEADVTLEPIPPDSSGLRARVPDRWRSVLE